MTFLVGEALTGSIGGRRRGPTRNRLPHSRQGLGYAAHTHSAKRKDQRREILSMGAGFHDRRHQHCRAVRGRRFAIRRNDALASHGDQTGPGALPDRVCPSPSHLGLAGKPMTVRRSTREALEERFPDLISASQPATGFVELRYVIDGVSVIVDASGQPFEMEDQRNWSDASYESYAQTFGFPHAYKVNAGEVVEHRLILTVSGGGVRPQSGAENSNSSLPTRAGSGNLPRARHRHGFGVGTCSTPGAARLAQTSREDRFAKGLRSRLSQHERTQKATD